jgi:hypothetical protein
MTRVQFFKALRIELKRWHHDNARDLRLFARIAEVVSEFPNPIDRTDVSIWAIHRQSDILIS